MTPNDAQILQMALGWNAKCWAEPLGRIFDSIQILRKTNLKILEVGAGRASVAATILFRNHNDITVGYFNEQNKDDVIKMTDQMISFVGREDYKLKLRKTSIFDIDGQYDIIIMRSVLGGVFRKHRAGVDVNEFLEDLSNKHLKRGGYLITADNGLSFFHNATLLFGARANRWRFFRPTEFGGAVVQENFGVFSAFSFATRFGNWGTLGEDALFVIDSLLFPIFPNYPTAICSAYQMGARQRSGALQEKAGQT